MDKASVLGIGVADMSKISGKYPLSDNLFFGLLQTSAVRQWSQALIY